jgi:hypothetical protein
MNAPAPQPLSELRRRVWGNTTVIAGGAHEKFC